MKVVTFCPHDDDKKYMFEHLPLTGDHVHPFAIKHKEVMFVQKENTQEFFMVVKTVECITHNTYDEDSHNLIKTIRIYDCNPMTNEYREVKQILLE